MARERFAEEFKSEAVRQVVERGYTVADDGNKQVANGRVIAAKEFFVKHGVPEEVIRTSSRASGDFIAPIAMEEGRKLNRRVTIEVIMR